MDLIKIENDYVNLEQDFMEICESENFLSSKKICVFIIGAFAAQKLKKKGSYSRVDPFLTDFNELIAIDHYSFELLTTFEKSTNTFKDDVNNFLQDPKRQTNYTFDDFELILLNNVIFFVPKYTFTLPNLKVSGSLSIQRIFEDKTIPTIYFCSNLSKNEKDLISNLLSKKYPRIGYTSTIEKDLSFSTNLLSERPFIIFHVGYIKPKLPSFIKKIFSDQFIINPLPNYTFNKDEIKPLYFTTNQNSGYVELLESYKKSLLDLDIQNSKIISITKNKKKSTSSTDEDKQQLIINSDSNLVYFGFRPEYEQQDKDSSSSEQDVKKTKKKSIVTKTLKGLIPFISIIPQPTPKQVEETRKSSLKLIKLSNEINHINQEINESKKKSSDETKAKKEELKRLTSEYKSFPVTDLQLRTDEEFKSSKQYLYPFDFYTYSSSDKLFQCAVPNSYHQLSERMRIQLDSKTIDNFKFNSDNANIEFYSSKPLVPSRPPSIELDSPSQIKNATNYPNFYFIVINERTKNDSYYNFISELTPGLNLQSIDAVEYPRISRDTKSNSGVYLLILIIGQSSVKEYEKVKKRIHPCFKTIPLYINVPKDIIPATLVTKTDSSSSSDDIKKKKKETLPLEFFTFDKENDVENPVELLKIGDLVNKYDGWITKITRQILNPEIDTKTTTTIVIDKPKLIKSPEKPKETELGKQQDDEEEDPIVYDSEDDDFILDFPTKTKPTFYYFSNNITDQTKWDSNDRTISEHFSAINNDIFDFKPLPAWTDDITFDENDFIVFHLDKDSPNASDIFLLKSIDNPKIYFIGDNEDKIKAIKAEFGDKYKDEMILTFDVNKPSFWLTIGEWNNRLITKIRAPSLLDDDI